MPASRTPGNPNRKTAARGFTFIELVISMVIIVVIAGMAFPMAELIDKRQKEKELKIALRAIRNAIDRYHLAATDNIIVHIGAPSRYPPTLDALAAGADDARALGNKKVYFLRRVPRNPFYENAQTDNADTWGRRAYASPPDNPQAGDDVYDVYAPGDGVGLNGRPYNEW